MNEMKKRLLTAKDAKIAKATNRVMKNMGPRNTQKDAKSLEWDEADECGVDRFVKRPRILNTNTLIRFMSSTFSRPLAYLADDKLQNLNPQTRLSDLCVLRG